MLELLCRELSTTALAEQLTGLSLKALPQMYLSASMRESLCVFQ